MASRKLNVKMSSQRAVLLLSAITALVMFSWAMYTRVKREEHNVRDGHTSGVGTISVRASSGADSNSVREDATMETAQPLYQDIVKLDEPKFYITSDFKFPHPMVYLPTVKILESDWVQQLKAYLLSIHPARSLTVTVATYSFFPNLLNWLIAAHLLVEPPMEHVLVLALDEQVHSLLSPRKIPCIHIPFKAVLKGMSLRIKLIWMTRLAVLRLLNHWGYDVLQLDSDAMPLRNPHTLFDDYMDYDIVSSRGSMPLKLSRGPWKFTVCMGAILLRGTKGMEALWNIIQSTDIMGSVIDDQSRFNFALYNANLEWGPTEGLLDDRVIVGASQNGTTRVANLPERYICRKTCDPSSMSEYYIWHQSGGKHKPKKKSEQNTLLQMWFLRNDHEKMLTAFSTTHVQWLEQLAIPDSLQNIRRRLNTSSRDILEKVATN